jgi:hypothetical protein
MGCYSHGTGITSQLVDGVGLVVSFGIVSDVLEGYLF